uniref:Endonuclease/exonuclease/phosphatase domain-containing protein n=1 Tax=Panagrolaimus sp. JU765 TaxID=591449 RepID=A0AC34RJ09_9BILA
MISETSNELQDGDFSFASLALDAGDAQVEENNLNQNLDSANESENSNDSEYDVSFTPRASMVPTIVEYKPLRENEEWSKFRIGGAISCFPDFSVFHVKMSMLLIGNNGLTFIPDSIRKMQNLKHLDISNNALTILPTAIGELENLTVLKASGNRLEYIPFCHAKLSSLECYDLTNNPLNAEFSRLYMGPENTAMFISNLSGRFIPEIPPSPGDRFWNIRRETASSELPIFDAMSFNVLFDRYATTQHYPYCAKWALSWPYRYGKIINEITSRSPHVVALQEVGIETFHNFFKPTLEAHGYTGVFAPKGRIRSNDFSAVDGSALFWKTENFTFISSETLEFGTLAIAFATGRVRESMLNRMLPYDNVAIVATLQPIPESFSASGRVAKSLLPIVACSAHVFWDPEFCDVKLMQAMILVQEMNRIVQSVAKLHSTAICDIPTLVMGDFNSLPDSGVFQYINQGYVERDHPDFLSFVGYQLDHMTNGENDSLMYRHTLSLKSAIDHRNFPYTNYTSKFCGFIDYIFYSPKALCNIGYLTFDHSWSTNNQIEGFPNEHIPSDHIPIAARFGIIDPSSKDEIVKNLILRTMEKSI